LMKHFKEHRTMKTFPGAKEITADEFFSLPVDILVPCALENAVTADIAKKINAKLIVEGANGPVTIDADQILEEKGIPVVPDILANAGGVTVSYFEWVQNLYGYYWSEEEVNQKEEAAMVDAFTAVYKVKEEYSVTFRRAAYMHSIKKIAAAMKIRGWY